jgi:adenylosuccinate synthase
MKAQIVLGMGYGDEGKGITVDNLCKAAQDRSEDAIVVRFSGGQQCGHDVHISDKISHVHSSFGSGTLRGVPSFFSQHCTMYLPRIVHEWEALTEKGVSPLLMIHGMAKVTTPYDVVFNRLHEKTKKHGSVGIGIGTTMHRQITTPHKLHVVDFHNEELFLQKMQAVRAYYMKQAEEILQMPGYQFVQACRDEVALFHTYLHEWKKYFFIRVNYAELARYGTVIFEGSQGIMLDMDHGVFPNVTYSHTTSRNAIEICELLGIRQPDVYYVTRCYYTRHGNGHVPLGNELALTNNHMEKNVSHEFQGEFKTREIQYGLLNQALLYDALYCGPANKYLVVTCLDQLPTFDVDKLISELHPVFKKVYATNSHITRGLWEMSEAGAALA